MRLCNTQSWIVAGFFGFLAFSVVLFLLVQSPFPEYATIEESNTTSKELIGWGLKRQSTHASLFLSSLFGTFSILRLNNKILKKPEAKIAFGGCLIFFSYEYFKLVRNFQIVYKLEENLRLLLPLDRVQELIFLFEGESPSFLNNSTLAVGAFLVVTCLIRIYISTIQLKDCARAKSSLKS